MLHIIDTICRKRISFYTNTDITLKDSKWEVIFSVGNKSVIISEGIQISDNEVDVFLDTSLLQVGKLEAQLNVRFIDINFPDKERVVKLNITNPDDHIVYGLLR